VSIRRFKNFPGLYPRSPVKRVGQGRERRGERRGGEVREGKGMGGQGKGMLRIASKGDGRPCIG
jgi:hypothetical protein